jgi:hypothetical protein
MTFGEPKLTSLVLDHEAFVARLVQHAITEFNACLDNSEEQKGVSCRYFSRGIHAGLSQAELIELLALSVPSVLDKAGYSPEAADQLMLLVGQLSEAEIQSPG